MTALGTIAMAKSDCQYTTSQAITRTQFNLRQSECVHPRPSCAFSDEEGSVRFIEQQVLSLFPMQRDWKDTNSAKNTPLHGPVKYKLECDLKLSLTNQEASQESTVHFSCIKEQIALKITIQQLSKEWWHYTTHV